MLKIDPDWLEGDDVSRETVTCVVCAGLLQQPVSACPEGHPACRSCYTKWLALKRECPQCRHPTLRNKSNPHPDPRYLRSLRALRARHHRVP